MIFPLKIPPGAFRNGTEYQSKGRWRDVNLVRWRNGAMQPVGAWQAFTVNRTNNSTVSNAMAWTDNSGNDFMLIGGAVGLDVMESDGTTTDIGGQSGSDTDSWSFATFGEIPLVCLDSGGTIQEWDLNTANPVTTVSNAPTSCTAVFVADERFVFALGAGGDPRRVEWCDRDDRTVWTAAATNQAGGFTLDTEGEIQFALQMRGEVLIVTTKDAWTARYIGYPQVWDFRKIGPCSAISKHCGIGVGDRAFWWGEESFYTASGGYVEQMPCDVWDHIDGDASEGQDKGGSNRNKTHGWHNSQFGEVEWLYVASGSSYEHVDRYVTYNYREGWWSYGKKGASVICDSVPFTNPIGFHRPSSGNGTTNGTFASDTGWTKGTAWQISGGVASQTTPTASDLSQTVTATIGSGQQAIVTFTVANRTAGSLNVSLGSGTTAISTNATHTILLTAAVSPPVLTFSADGTWDGDIDNVTVKTVTTREHELDPASGSYGDHYITDNAPYAETGPLEIGDGEHRTHVTKVYPDEQDGGELSLTFKSREYPTATETTYTSITSANPTSVRFSGRQFKLKVEPVALADWRSGVHRLELKPGGKR